MRSRLATQFMAFFSGHSAYFNVSRQKVLYFNVYDKTELYLTVLQQNNVEACLRCEASLSLALSGLLSCSLWLPLARSCSLRLPIALRICVQHPRSAHKALAQLAAALLRCNTFCCSVCRFAAVWCQRSQIKAHLMKSYFVTAKLNVYFL